VIHDNRLVDILLFLAVLAPSVILHEVAHGWIAERFGDPTARDAGRITLNPIKHIDPFGSILFPAVLAMMRANVWGWAKPVPVNPSYFRRPNEMMAVVALGGPITNLVLAFVAGRLGPFEEIGGVFYKTSSGLWVEVLWAFAVVNVALAIFNMLPIPPLDGSRLLPLVLSERAREAYWRVSQYGFLILFALIFLFEGALDFIGEWILTVLRVLV
jgi:Zn-dependent protease